GPLYVRGDVTIQSASGEITASDMRLALCRCGQSQNKPFCDNSHKAAGFSDAGDVKPRQADEFVPGGPLTITANANGSLMCEGNIEVVSADGTGTFAASKTWLCRCGGSANKPFCDGTHKRNGFQA
ncbi:MAG: CDGSH iron-sulfur domain-containing protein, partial [Caldilinea sp.]|nr:CDGSH iron-sulfur domain-containing protein [Caldilinea sp.]